MRIAIIQGAFLPVPAIRGGAVEKMWFSLGKEFARRGHEVVHFSRKVDGLPRSEVIDLVSHIRISGFDTPKSGLLLKLCDLMYTLKVRNAMPTGFDVVISNTFWAPILLSGKNRRVCLVDVERMPKGQMRWYQSIARLRATSTPVAEAIRRETPAHLHDKVVVIPSPLPFTPSESVDYQQKKPVILYAGRIHPEKGLDVLIKAFRQTDQRYRLQLVGPWDVAVGGGGKAYFDSLKQLAGDAAIDFVGPIYDIDALNKFYTDAAVFVYPSLADRGETFGLAPLEAMAWGCVPIVSKVACFQDFITPGENGLLFDHCSPDAVQQLAGLISRIQEEDELRQQLAENALKVRKTHSIQHIATRFLKEFQGIVGQTSQYNANEPVHA
ncbi:glycosyltransferase family 4 protein [Larkinella bovis]|uniref:Glycosyltransferase family 4 protein n=1 Tax=Larkinella bovis TaxID=683041 RepID=A0ABW0IN13_9BACT